MAGSLPKAGGAEVRCFVAVLLPEPVRRAAAAVAEELAAAGAPVRWVAPQTLHLTLKFLGEVPRGDVDGIAAVLRAAALAEAPFEVTLAGAGGLPSATRPRVVTLGVTRGARELERLAARVEAALEPLGFPRESRPFVPHVTLGRLRDPSAPGRLPERLRNASAVTVGSFRVEELALMASRLSAEGASYRRLDAFRLEGAG